MIRHSEKRRSDLPLVELRDVCKRFMMHHEANRSIQESLIRFLQGRRTERRSFWSVQHLSFTIQPGDSLGIVGSNGSGKSTLLKLITGVLEPTSGDIVTYGRISSLLELGAGFHPELNGRENIFLNGSIVGLSRREMVEKLDSIIDFAELGDFIDVPVKHYSSGMYVRLGFAVAVHTDPDLLLVDEVLAVGDTAFQHKCMDRIQQFRASGGALLLVSHDLHAIQSLCKQAIWLDHGKVMATGKPSDVVMTYLNRVAQQEEANATARAKRGIKRPEEKQRWGNRKIEITRVELFNPDGTERSVFVTGCAMEIRLHYRASERIEDPVFGLAIHHQDGTHLAGPNSGFAGLIIPFAEGEGQVTYRISSLSLLEGGYLISVSSHNRDETEMYDYHDRVYPFRVYPDTSRQGYGLMTLNGHWQHLSYSEPQVSMVMAGNRQLKESEEN